MSEPTAPREWRFYIDDMLQFCERVQSYTAGIAQDAFVAEAMRYDATVRNLELLGDAAMRIPEAVRAAHPEVPWRLIVATRNRLIHGYLGIDNDILWSLIHVEVPRLALQLRTLRDQPESP
ncbi:HepT-like ribonuclease domain-containing protein [Pseudorhodoferax soli]|uniref:Uncharacterized protein with HEPN domain n=1 Tax=Pseudorhodoferax soli TaxID=545864 RepID=A0A368XXG7_9BURK|nr:DUF86 domain-containing protein [Pseudorhodoferax soli]RCW72681.1 uncharacterized protein with HEPN domain [Pseudorhodoferax soli]